MSEHDRTLVTVTASRCTPRARWLVAACAALAAAVAGAEPSLGTIEECIETGTDVVSLPGVPAGTLSASACSGCESLRLGFDRRTRYFIGKQPVPYAQFREAAARGEVRLYLFYAPGTRILTRLRLDAAGNDK